MHETLSREDLRQLLLALAADMIAARDTLTELDAAIGDGDLGVTLTLGYRAVQAALAASGAADLQGPLNACATAFADNAASTYGALLATMFTRAGRAVKGKEAIGPAEAAAMLAAAAEGVRQRGKAELGDKTVLDALVPAAQAAEKAAGEGGSLLQCLEAAAAAAQGGVEATAGMKARTGRAAWLGDRTMGAKDPGAVAFTLMLQSAARFVRG